MACIAVVVVASSGGNASSFIDMEYLTFLLGILLLVMLALWETWRHSKGSMLATPWSVGTAAETTLDQSSGSTATTDMAAAGSPADNAKSDEQVCTSWGAGLQPISAALAIAEDRFLAEDRQGNIRQLQGDGEAVCRACGGICCQAWLGRKPTLLTQSMSDGQSNHTMCMLKFLMMNIQ